ncbi:uncharacterized protein LOC108831164 [Raphanus sativus]|uniref:Uncharacterized protein LOC108831164 n=1 Tax=Raphanus sativus TaxID=3726 RepID=A0A6J0LJV3_RAPSA|nr:uncharacterized protein LOC108831164 [Raphanus sativus]
MEFVLVDETGRKIHATCKRTYIESKGRLLTVGCWRYIQNFQVSPAGGAYRTTNHAWKIVFNQNTSITRSNHSNDELYLDLVDFQTVLSGTLDDNLLIDVLGQIVDCGEVETIQCAGGKQRKKLDLTLSNINDSQLPCCIWGNLAEKLHSAINQEDGTVTMLLRFAKVGRFRGDLQISNAFDASQMLINPPIPEAEAFKALISGDEKSLTSFMSNEDSHEDNNKQVSLSGKRGNRDKWLLFPSKSIQEMITSTQIDRCLVRCTMYAIDMDWSWYYFGCQACNKKVIKTGTQVKKVNGQEIVTHSWWCETCKDTVFEVSPRFWLHLMINDDTGVSKIMILDKVANGIVSETPEKLLNGSWDELEDPTLVPECITDLIGQDFTFGVYIEKENVAYGSEIYKVGKIYKDRTPFDSNVITTGQDNKPLSITCVDEGSHDISESQETADAISTPSNKRKEEETNEQGDLCSTSKKPCTRLIKFEKVEQAKKND